MKWCSCKRVGPREVEEPVPVDAPRPGQPPSPESSPANAPAPAIIEASAAARVPAGGALDSASNPSRHSTDSVGSAGSAPPVLSTSTRKKRGGRRKNGRRRGGPDVEPQGKSVRWSEKAIVDGDNEDQLLSAINFENYESVRQLVWTQLQMRAHFHQIEIADYALSIVNAFKNSQTKDRARVCELLQLMYINDKEVRHRVLEALMDAVKEERNGAVGGATYDPVLNGFVEALRLARAGDLTWSQAVVEVCRTVFDRAMTAVDPGSVDMMTAFLDAIYDIRINLRLDADVSQVLDSLLHGFKQRVGKVGGYRDPRVALLGGQTARISQEDYDLMHAVYTSVPVHLGSTVLCCIGTTVKQQAPVVDSLEAMLRPLADEVLQGHTGYDLRAGGAVSGGAQNDETDAATLTPAALQSLATYLASTDLSSYARLRAVQRLMGAGAVQNPAILEPLMTFVMEVLGAARSEELYLGVLDTLFLIILHSSVTNAGAVMSHMVSLRSSALDAKGKPLKSVSKHADHLLLRIVELAEPLVSVPAKSMLQNLGVSVKHAANSPVPSSLPDTYLLREVQVKNNKYSTDQMHGVPSFLQKIKDKAERDEVASSLMSVYVPLQGSDEGRPYDLMDSVKLFLNDPQKKVMLISGPAGAGKSTFGKMLELHMHESGLSKSFFPVLIDLPSLDNPTGRAIQETFEAHGAYYNLIENLRLSREYLFILDGYDKIGKRKNLYASNELARWNCKVIITCRSQYLAIIENYKRLFMPVYNSADNATDNNVFLEREFTEANVAPLSLMQMERYVESYIRTSRPQWNQWRQYLDHMEAIPGLLELARTPFVLQMMTRVLPELVKEEQVSNKPFTLSRIYAVYIRHWFSRSVETTLVKKARVVESSDVLQRFLSLCKDMAKRMLASGRSLHALTNEMMTLQQGFDLDQFFGTKAQRVENIKEGCPIVVSERYMGGRLFGFAHRSVMEYFFAVDLMERLKSCAGSRKDAIRVLSCTPAGGAPAAGDEDEMATSYIAHETVMLEFFSDFVRSDKELEKILLEVVAHSKKNSAGGMVCTAASNAMSALSAARSTFTGMNLKGIKVPWANLAGAVMEGASLQDADLRHAILKNTWLRGANLNGARLDGATFLENTLQQTGEEPITCVAQSLNGKHFATGDSAGVARLWDSSGKYVVHELKGHNEAVSGLSFSANCKTLVSSSRDSTIYVWSVDNGQAVSILTDQVTHEGQLVYRGVNAVATSPASNVLLASGGDSMLVKIWRTDKSANINSFAGHTERINCLAFSRDGGWLASGSGEIKEPSAPQEGDEAVSPPDGSGQITYRRNSSGPPPDRTVRVWEVATGRCIHRFQHEAPVYVVVFEPGGRFVASGCDSYIEPSDGMMEPGMVFLWSLERGQLLRRLASGIITMKSVRALAFCPGRRNELAVAGKDESAFGSSCVFLWNLDDVFGQVGKRQRQIPQGNPTLVHRASVSPAAYKSQAAVAKRKKTVYGLVGPSLNLISKTLTGHIRTINGVAYSPDGTMLLSCSNDANIRVWENLGGKEDTEYTFHALTDVIYAVEFSDDGSLLLCCEKSRVTIWRVATGDRVKVFAQRRNGVLHCASFVPGSTRVLVGDESGTISLWDGEAGQMLETLPTAIYGRTPVFCMAVSASGGRVVAGRTSENTIETWSVLDGHYHSNEPLAHGAKSICFAKNDTLVSSGSDAVIKVWRPSDYGFEVVFEIRMQQPLRMVNSLVCSNQGWIAAGDDLGDVNIFSLSCGEYLGTLRALLAPDSEDGRADPGHSHSHDSRVKGLSYDPQSGVLASVSADRTLRLWQVKSLRDGKQFSKCPSPVIIHAGRGQINTVCLSSGGALLCMGGWDGGLRLFERSGSACDYSLQWTTAGILNLENVKFAKTEGVSYDIQQFVHLRQRSVHFMEKDLASKHRRRVEPSEVKMVIPDAFPAPSQRGMSLLSCMACGAGSEHKDGADPALGLEQFFDESAAPIPEAVKPKRKKSKKAATNEGGPADLGAENDPDAGSEAKESPGCLAMMCPARGNGGDAAGDDAAAEVAPVDPFDVNGFLQAAPAGTAHGTPASPAAAGEEDNQLAVASQTKKLGMFACTSLCDGNDEDEAEDGEGPSAKHIRQQEKLAAKLEKLEAKVQKKRLADAEKEAARLAKKEKKEAGQEAGPGVVAGESPEGAVEDAKARKLREKEEKRALAEKKQAARLDIKEEELRLAVERKQSQLNTVQESANWNRGMSGPIPAEQGEDMAASGTDKEMAKDLEKAQKELDKAQKALDAFVEKRKADADKEELKKQQQRERAERKRAGKPAPGSELVDGSGEGAIVPATPKPLGPMCCPALGPTVPDAKAGDGDGEVTALHAACMSLDYKAAKRAINAGVSLDALDASGMTPLAYICATAGKNSEKLCLLLLQKGAHVNTTTAQGETPLDLAVRHRNDPVTPLLSAYGALHGSELNNPKSYNFFSQFSDPPSGRATPAGLGHGAEPQQGSIGPSSTPHQAPPQMWPAQQPGQQWQHQRQGHQHEMYGLPSSNPPSRAVSPALPSRAASPGPFQ